MDGSSFSHPGPYFCHFGRLFACLCPVWILVALPLRFQISVINYGNHSQQHKKYEQRFECVVN